MVSDQKEKEHTFEELLLRLSEIVEKLEGHDLSIEESAALFEEGVELSRICRDRLRSVEDKLTEIKSLEDENKS